MKKHIIATALLAIAGSLTSQAATGFFDGLYVIINTGSGNTFYQATTGTSPGSGAAQGHNLTSDGINPTFTTLGTFQTTDTFTLNGFEYKTFENNGSDVTFGNLFWRIYPTGSPSGSFNQIQDNTNPGSGNNTWTINNAGINLLSGLSPGTYTLNIYTESYTNGTNTAGNIFGFTSNSPTATFTVVPEPSTCLLLGAGLTTLLFRRRRFN